VPLRLLRAGVAALVALVLVALAPAPIAPSALPPSTESPPTDAPPTDCPTRWPDVLAAADTLAPLRSLVVARGDSVVAARYRGGMRFDRAVNIKSASKSLLGLLAGLALADGSLASVEQPVAPFFPDVLGDSARRARGLDPRVAALTVEDLLTMRAGLKTTSFAAYGAWVAQDDWVEAALTRPMVRAPGGPMIYSTGTTHVLGALLAEATGRPLRAYAEERLFGPLGIEAGAWQTDAQGRYFGGNNLALSPRALLRLGQLVLGRGTWRGRRLLPPAWIDRMTHPHVGDSYRGFRYGYLWWIEDFGGTPGFGRGADAPAGAQVDAQTEPEAYRTVFAWGYGGQFLFVTPGLDLVVVVTSSLAERTRGHTGRVFRFMDETLIPAAACLLPPPP
jgi:CubicO group peptidase (beta-lactamase class C family)